VEIYLRGEWEVSPKKERTKRLQLDTEQNAKEYGKEQEERRWKMEDGSSVNQQSQNNLWKVFHTSPKAMRIKVFERRE
jgi:hypothetical protein